LFALFHQSNIPVAKRQAWTAEQKWYAIELKRKSPDKEPDYSIVAIKAKYDRDVSASSLKPSLAFEAFTDPVDISAQAALAPTKPQSRLIQLSSLHIVLLN
jgi:hypothetical protein